RRGDGDGGPRDLRASRPGGKGLRGPPDRRCAPPEGREAGGARGPDPRLARALLWALRALDPAAVRGGRRPRVGSVQERLTVPLPKTAKARERSKRIQIAAA